jgi:hypothetical protein
MDWITRYYEKFFDKMLQKGKVLVIHGPRQVGKTSFIKHMLSKDQNTFIGDGNDIVIRDLLNSGNLTQIQNNLGAYNIVFIDEGQMVENIGLALKLLADHEPELKIVTCGSSSFDLSGKLGEPLTGRQKVFHLYPVSVTELLETNGQMWVVQQLENLLVYGSYPEVLTIKNNADKSQHLINIRNSYLLKDILQLENIRNASKLFDLLRLLAFQIGNEVSLNELSNQLGMAKQTIERYIDLLEKVYVIKKLEGFSRNLRKEITKTHRYYFWDNGIRNAVINNFNPLNLRNDQGMLWENFMFTERMKTQEYLKIHANNFFWRTYDQKEIDLVEERNGKLFGYEFKWGKKVKKPPKLWIETYQNAEFMVINKENFIGFLTGKIE